jgi:hypothetical protein
MDQRSYSSSAGILNPGNRELINNAGSCYLRHRLPAIFSKLVDAHNPRFGVDNPEFTHASGRVQSFFIDEVQLSRFRRQDFHHKIGCTLCSGFRQDACMLVEGQQSVLEFALLDSAVGLRAKEFRHFYEYLEPGATVVFHDTGVQFRGMADAIRELTKEGRLVGSFFQTPRGIFVGSVQHPPKPWIS